MFDEYRKARKDDVATPSFKFTSGHLERADFHFQTAGRRQTAGRGTRRCGNIQTSFELEQLAHETKVRRDVGFSAFHEVVGIV